MWGWHIKGQKWKGSTQYNILTCEIYKIRQISKLKGKVMYWDWLGGAQIMTKLMCQAFFKLLKFFACEISNGRFSQKFWGKGTV